MIASIRRILSRRAFIQRGVALLEIFLLVISQFIYLGVNPALVHADSVADSYTDTTKIDTANSSGYSVSSGQVSASYNFGDGVDGTITVSSNTNINTDTLISGRSCADGGDAVNYNVSSVTDSDTVVLSSTPSSGCLAAGDEVMVINLQGTTSNYGNVGNYEFLTIDSVSGSTVNFTTSKTKYYGNGTDSNDTNIGTGSSNQRVMLQRVPNYTDVTVNSSRNFYPSAWNGTKGGVLAFRANGTVTVTGTIHANGKGYRGGNGGTHGSGGEAFCANPGGGNASGGSGSCGGGADYNGQGSSTGGAGGAGANNPTCQTVGGHGGGGGYGTAGKRGGSWGAQNGGNNTSGNGETWTQTWAGGGGGGGTYGSASLADLFFGSAGGGGGAGRPSSQVGCGVETGGDGGDGGGIVFIGSDTLTVTGAITSTGLGGPAGGGSFYGSGGSGAGGSIKIEASSATLGSSLVSANSNDPAKPGAAGDGGSGRIAVKYASSISGTTSPSANSTNSGEYFYNVTIQSTIGVRNSPS